MDTIESPRNTGAGNVIMQFEERSRRQQLQSRPVRPRFSTSPAKTSESPAKDEGQSTPVAPPGISSVSSQDSTQTTNSVASRRQRIMALSAKNKARHYGKPVNASSPMNTNRPEPVETQHSNASEMEDYDGKEQSSCSAAPSPNKKGVSDKIRNFQRDLGMTHSSNGRSSPPPPPPPPLPDSHKKSWNDRDGGSRVVAYPSHTARRAASPVSGLQQTKGLRVAVPRSPTPSIASVDSSFSGHLPRPSSPSPSFSANRNSWNNNNNRVNAVHKVNRSPEVRRSFASPKYGSPQPRHSTGSIHSIESYKQFLKPAQTDVKKSHEKEAYGAIIETPEKSSVSGLHAMFESKNNKPLMPMNSTNSSVRHSLPLRSPVTPPASASGGGASRYRSFAGPGRSNLRHSFDESAGDDRSVSSARSASSANRPRQSVVASWSQKNEQNQSNSSSHSTEAKEDKSRVSQYYNSSWRMQSPVDQERPELKVSTDERGNNKGFSSWQQRCKPRPLEGDVPESPVPSTDANAAQIEEKPREKNASKGLPLYSIASLMYSEKKKRATATVDWPSDTNGKNPTADCASDTVTDVILDSLTDVIPNDLELPRMVDRAPSRDSTGPLKTASSTDTPKPWENDTKNSVVQTWQKRSSKPKDLASSSSNSIAESSRQTSKKSEGLAAPSFGDSAPDIQAVGDAVEVNNDTKNESEICATNSGDSFIEEKKSGDLSFDEDEILGQNIDGPKKYINNESSQHGDPSNHPHKMPFYDDDSYLTNTDTHTRGLGQSESMRSQSSRLRTSATYNSEDMSIYTSDERTISQRENNILSSQMEQVSLEVAEEEKSELKEEPELKEEETKAPALTINVNPPPVKANLPRLNPSPKDSDAYKSKYFEDSGASAAKSTRGRQDMPVSTRKDNSVRSKRSTENQVIDIWASTSQEERVEAIEFDETDRWLDQDPDIPDSVDDVSVSSEQENADKNINKTQNPDPEPRPILIKKPPQKTFLTPEQQMQRTKAMSSNTKKPIIKQQPKQDVFDPFGFDGEGSGELRVEISDDLFSSNPDPFATAESFSPLEWSSPRESNTNSNTKKNAANSNPQHIGYYNSPDSRVEI